MNNVFFFDIDSTIYRSDLHCIPEQTKKALQQLLENGSKVWLVSSRSIHETAALEESFLKISFSGIVLEGGALILNEQRKPVQKLFIDAKDMETIARFCKEHGLLWRYSSERHNSFASKPDAADRYAMMRLYLVSPNYRPYTQDECFNVLVWSNDQPLLEQLAASLKHCSAVLYPHCIEIRHEAASKEAAVQGILSGYPESYSAAFGDGMNDIGMLEMADTGVAVANACQEVLDAADEITASVEEAGAAKWLQKKGYVE